MRAFHSQKQVREQLEARIVKHNVHSAVLFALDAGPCLVERLGACENEAGALGLRLGGEAAGLQRLDVGVRERGEEREIGLEAEDG